MYINKLYWQVEEKGMYTSRLEFTFRRDKLIGDSVLVGDTSYRPHSGDHHTLGTSRDCAGHVVQFQTFTGRRTVV